MLSATVRNNWLVQHRSSVGNIHNMHHVSADLVLTGINVLVQLFNTDKDISTYMQVKSDVVRTTYYITELLLLFLPLN